MPTVPIHLPDTRPERRVNQNGSFNPLPSLLQTPSGLAIIEMQGTINLPLSALNKIEADIEAGGHSDAPAQFETPIGRLIFPDYRGKDTPADDKGWMKRVYLYVGQNQRMTGEVKAIPKPLAVLRRVERNVDDDNDVEMSDAPKRQKHVDELEIVDIIKYRIYFKLRPEPVSSTTAIPN
ncbi:hypothetical protein KEM56_006791 [Ascosphaera pollenicola]|nr:hypothetical protein KEM56_006791 [Ascosphaera pollenicola]